MSIKISKYYEQLVSFGAGTFENAKIGVTLTQSTECSTGEELKEANNKLMKLAKALVNKDVEELKIERGIKTN